MPDPTTPSPFRPDGPPGRKPFTAGDTVGDIVARLPEAAGLFRDARIDYCCGGKQTLRDALEERGFDVQPFLDELNRLLSAAISPEDGRRIDWRTEPLSRLSITSSAAITHTWSRNFRNSPRRSRNCCASTATLIPNLRNCTGHFTS